MAAARPSAPPWCGSCGASGSFGRHPLVSAAALRADAPWAPADWLPVFLTALADEAEDGLQLLMTLERAWFTARRAAAGRRSTSRAAVAIDVLAAAPLISSTSLGRALGMAVKNAAALLERFCGEGIAVEVTHRSKRRLFGLAALAPLRNEVAPPRRPQPGRGRGRPPILPAAEAIEPPPALPPLMPLEQRTFDYSGLDAAMALADEAMRNARKTLAVLAKGGSETATRSDAQVLQPAYPNDGAEAPAATKQQPGGQRRGVWLTSWPGPTSPRVAGSMCISHSEA